MAATLYRPKIGWSSAAPMAHASGPSLVRSGSSSTPPNRRGSFIAIWPPSAKWATNRFQAGSSRLEEYSNSAITGCSSIIKMPVMPNRSPTVAPTVSISMSFPTRPNDSIVAPSSAVRNVSGSTPLIYQSSGVSIDDTVRPISGAAPRRYISISSSSGTGQGCQRALRIRRGQGICRAQRQPASDSSRKTVVPMGAVDDLILGFDAGVASEVSQVDL